AAVQLPVIEDFDGERPTHHRWALARRSISRPEPFFKTRSIVSLNVADVEQWLLWMEQDRKLSARTRRQRFSFFSGMMDWAVVNEIIGRNPCKKVKGAGSRAKEIREHKSTAR
ncbi:site-specific integrase, partial [Streptomyces avermitilis]